MLEPPAKSFTQERIAYLVYNFGSRFYSFGGLKEYKDKYANEWLPKYVLIPVIVGLVMS